MIIWLLIVVGVVVGSLMLVWCALNRHALKNIAGNWIKISKSLFGTRKRKGQIDTQRSPFEEVGLLELDEEEDSDLTLHEDEHLTTSDLIAALENDIKDNSSEL